MNAQEHLLTCLAEECAEVAQEVAKALRFGLDDKKPGQDRTNAERIASEMGDLLAVYNMLEHEGLLPTVTTCFAPKQMKVEQYMAYARTRGTLSPARTALQSDNQEGEGRG
ncbi:MazG nucleotide pyrophosphohydrolase domain-containing protein [Tianweitania sediminis]|uniref:NTP pyrophosphohydrolase MazG-like domain-containing protein n=1 Tax=Tianweitania sediminis TaxID=1502156 RepID=A0A8J7UK15_9HYPH|nr:MazG nucleotide pyrophosphohydrolase domain-containing protein [Tianweitania sediminis]MBP0440643.1 hypothetical protein [Tianweitania sediminis]